MEPPGLEEAKRALSRPSSRALSRASSQGDEDEDRKRRNSAILRLQQEERATEADIDSDLRHRAHLDYTRRFIQESEALLGDPAAAAAAAAESGPGLTQRLRLDLSGLGVGVPGVAGTGGAADPLAPAAAAASGGRPAQPSPAQPAAAASGAGAAAALLSAQNTPRARSARSPRTMRAPGVADFPLRSSRGSRRSPLVPANVVDSDDRKGSVVGSARVHSGSTGGPMARLVGGGAGAAAAGADASERRTSDPGVAGPVVAHRPVVVGRPAATIQPRAAGGEAAPARPLKAYGADVVEALGLAEDAHWRMQALGVDLQLSRSFFALPAANPMEQVLLFGRAVSLLTEGRVAPPARGAAPPDIANEALLGLRALGVEVDAAPSRVAKGHGLDACRVLHAAAAARSDLRLGLQPVYRDPEVPEAGSDGDDASEADAGAGDGDVVEDDLLQQQDEDDPWVAHGGARLVVEPEPMIAATVDADAWLVECERVRARLRAPATGDGWRGRAHTMRTEAARLEQRAPAVGRLLADHGAGLRDDLERLGRLESALNRRAEPLAAEFRDAKEGELRMRALVDASQGAVAALAERCDGLGERLGEVKGALDARSATLSEASPVVRIKAAVAALRDEIAAMDVRIGVAQTCLLRASAGSGSRPRGSRGSRGAEVVVESDDDDDDL